MYNEKVMLHFIMRLPYAFSKLAGMRTRIDQTVHDGALALLVVGGSRSAATQ